MVKGTLLVTPNAVMFDPNVSDPLVMQNGIEEYGMIAKLDTVVSAAIYRDSQAMQSLRLHKYVYTCSYFAVKQVVLCDNQIQLAYSRLF